MKHHNRIAHSLIYAVVLTVVLSLACNSTEALAKPYYEFTPDHKNYLVCGSNSTVGSTADCEIHNDTSVYNYNQMLADKVDKIRGEIHSHHDAYNNPSDIVTDDNYLQAAHDDVSQDSYLDAINQLELTRAHIQASPGKSPINDDNVRASVLYHICIAKVAIIMANQPIPDPSLASTCVPPPLVPPPAPPPSVVPGAPPTISIEALIATAIAAAVIAIVIAISFVSLRLRARTR